MSETRKIVLASRNADKVRELKQLCVGLPFEVLSAADFPGLPDVIEDGTTIVGNAARKAIVTAAYTGEISVADDTSLEVRELGGFPDVFAARFSGPGATYASNAELVLELLGDAPDDVRQARFASACVWVDPRPARRDLKAPRPAGNRWLHNPWARSITVRHEDEAQDYWNGLLDRRRVWAEYRQYMCNDLTNWGHDAGGLARVADCLLDGHAGPGAGEGLWLPDPRIWDAGDPTDFDLPRTLVAPSGLDPEAPGRGVNGELWYELSAVGRLAGRINRQPVGGAGFGYDPIFVPEGLTITLAEMEPAAKNAISHRGQAFGRLMRAVRAAYGV